MDYYREAIDLIGKDENFLVFSDDIEWCKENFKDYVKSCEATGPFPFLNKSLTSSKFQYSYHRMRARYHQATQSLFYPTHNLCDQESDE